MKQSNIEYNELTGKISLHTSDKIKKRIYFLAEKMSRFLSGFSLTNQTPGAILLSN